LNIFPKLPNFDDLFKRVSVAFKEEDRSSLLIKNVINSIGIKGIGILISLILIPLSIKYVGAVNYGIWLTISSVVGWMTNFDLGLGNGLRNRITEDYALKKYDDGKKYVSTTYAVMFLISAIFFVLFLLVHTFVDWTNVFNTPSELAAKVDLIVILVLISFCSQFVFQIISVVLTAVHLSYKANVITSISLVISLIGVLCLTYFTEENLIYLVLVLAFSIVISLILYSIYFYSNELKVFKPEFRKIDFGKTKSLFGVGWLFFLIQLGNLVLYQTSNLIIANVLSLEDVSVFNVVYKYFSALFMIISVILNPYWSAFSDAYVLQDFVWIKKSLVKLRKIFFAFFVLNAICVLISPFVFKVWLGDSLLIPFAVSWSLGVYFIAFFWYNLHATFIFGVGKLYIQVFSVIISAGVNIPLSIFLGRIYGLPGVIFSNIIVFSFLGLVTYMQVQKIVNRKAIGFWNK
jgi:O-antigen/teichoic acid export membrane protein